MAVTTKVYGEAAKHIANGDLDWAADTIKVALVTSAYVPAQGTDEFFSDANAHEIAGSGGYSTGGFTLSGAARSYDSATREERYDADDVNPGALTPSAPFRYAIVYDASPGSAGTDFLLAYINFGADQDPAGLPFAIQWAATGVFYMQAA
jgi:hypothetical protein